MRGVVFGSLGQEEGLHTALTSVTPRNDLTAI